MDARERQETIELLEWMVRDSDEQLRAMNGVDRPAVARMQTGEVVFFPSEIEFTQEMKQYFMDRLTALRRGS